MMQFYVNDIEFDFDDDEANTICNSDLDTFFIASNSVRREVVEEHLRYLPPIRQDFLLLLLF